MVGTDFLLSAIQRAFHRSYRHWEHALEDALGSERQSLLSHISQQLEQGAKLIVLPELCDLPYFCLSALEPKSKSMWQSCAHTIETHPTLKAILDLLEHSSAVVCAPIYERDADHYYSTAVLLGPKQKILGKVRKAPIHRLAGMYEREFFKTNQTEAGYAVFDLSDIHPQLKQVGVTLSRGGKYFKAVEQMIKQGAKIILNPRSQAMGFSATVLENEIKLHAKNFNYALIQVNRAGTEDEELAWTWSGASTIINDQGEAVLRAPVAEEAILHVKMDDLLQNTTYAKPGLRTGIDNKTNPLESFKDKSVATNYKNAVSKNSKK